MRIPLLILLLFAIGLLNRGNDKISFDKSLQLTAYDTDFKPKSYTYRIDPAEVE